jgi:hypothetical protein
MRTVVALALLLALAVPAIADDGDDTRHVTIGDINKLLRELDDVCHMDWSHPNKIIRRQLADWMTDDTKDTDLIPCDAFWLREATRQLSDWQQMNDYQRFGYRMRRAWRRAEARLYELIER